MHAGESVGHAGQLDAAGERVGSRRALTQALGADSDVRPSMAELPLPGRLRLLLCTDGLHDAVAEKDLALVLAERGDDLAGAAAAIGTTAGVIAHAAMQGLHNIRSKKQHEIETVKEDNNG